MASKHDSHETFILAQLLDGVSYVKVAAALASLGCKTTPTEIYLWAKRRAEKKGRRAAMLQPQLVAASPVAPVAMAPAAPETLPIKSATPAAPTVTRRSSISKSKGSSSTNSQLLDDLVNRTVKDSSAVNWKPK
jgi:hypothetical protein